MRIELALSIGVGLSVIGLVVVVGLISRRSSRPDLGSVSGEWIAEQTRLDSDPR